MKKTIPILLAASALAAVNFVIIYTAPNWQREAKLSKRHGEIIHETTSDYAHIRVREKAKARSLMFVDASGEEQLQSRIDLDSPDTLELRYSRAMFASFLFRAPQERVLIVGLGGGGMVRFLNAAVPETLVEAVEIDPAVVSVAAEFFGTTDGPHTRIHTADAFVFLGEPEGRRYDVIYMDAFLRPSAEATDAEGLQEKAQRLKTAEFLQQIRARLVDPGGLVAFNLIERETTTPDDLAAIRSVFPTVYVFEVAQTGNIVVLASTDPNRLEIEELKARATRKEAEADWARSVGLEKVVDGLRSEDSPSGQAK